MICMFSFRIKSLKSKAADVLCVFIAIVLYVQTTSSVNITSSGVNEVHKCNNSYHVNDIKIFMTEDMFDNPEITFIRQQNIRQVARIIRRFSICSLDLRLCKVLDVILHPTNDRYYILTVDIGDRNLRTSVTPARPFYRRVDLLAKLFVCLANTYTEIRSGYYSNVMMLYALNSTAAELLQPPCGKCQLGDRICIAGHMPRPATRLRPEKPYLKAIIQNIHIVNNTVYYKKKHPLIVISTGGSIRSNTIRTGQFGEPFLDLGI